MKVCVVGAGVIGCASAYQLAKAGFEVQLVDAAPEPGTGTSFANGAQLSYSYVEPFASPGTLQSLPKMLWSADSPVKFRLRADWRQWTWGLQFLRACRRGTALHGTAALLDLAQRSRRVLDGWMAEERWSFGFAQNGKLVLCPDDETLRRQRAQVELQAQFGCRQQVLSPAECRDREPALAAAREDIAGGIWTEDECVADPYLLCRELVAGLRRLGGTVTFDTAVSGFVRDGRRYAAAQSDRGELKADAFVLAAGPHAAALASDVGLHLPVYPIKGYSITVPFKGGARPTASVTHLGRKTVFAPLGDRLRVAAMAEITGYRLDVPASRVRAMVDSVEAVYPGLCELDAPQTWAGLRPATPDSVPIIGRVRDSNVFVNAGQGALGLTLAAGSAERLAEAVQRYAA
ncbi:D-amino acid dehydrogenase [Rhizobacter sp. SG703]|uniref:D-amino acid dehydrogenase n=1 Tax=Rhizobacter sp. SG703 TaxID=2587140 RepID=UPI00144800C7|nr:D-amino acid dehydrogenase [Rhizobacter sp. SG703]NKI93380.1 D-amino-acid dehydrogenase [Rhizobacter sp. SG703]